MEHSKLLIDYKNVENQLSILLNEAQLLKSATVPDMKATISEKESKISEKNRTMLELRENFDEIVSQKDQIIDALRNRIAALHEEIQEEKNRANLEIRDNFNELLSEKDKEIETLQNKVQNLQDSIATEKERTSDELRQNFNEVISKKDEVISELQDKVKEFSNKVSENRMSAQNEMKLVSYAVVERDASVKKLTDDLNLMANDLSVVKKQRDWLRGELNRVIKERNTIGGSIQTQFESISGGLRGDLELAMEEKKTLESEYVIERLKLERELAEHKEMVDGLSQIVAEKDEKLSEKNLVIEELKSRVETASEILSKEKYYERLEQQFTEAQEKVMELIEDRSNVQRQMQEVTSEYAELMLKLDVAEEEKNSLIREVDANLQSAAVDKAEACQALRSEFEALLTGKDRILAELNHRVALSQEENVSALSDMKEDYERNKSFLEETNKSLSSRIKELTIEKEQLQKEAVDEILKSRDDQFVKIKADFDAMIDDRDKKIETLHQEQLDLKRQCDVLIESNTNLLDSANELKENNETLRQSILQLEITKSQLIAQQSSEIEKIVIEKGKGFKQLREQFEEVLEEKTQIIEGLRKRIHDLSSASDSLSTAVNEKSSESEKLRQEMIDKDLEIEQLKVKLESLADKSSSLESEIVSLKADAGDLKDNLAEAKREMEQSETMLGESQKRETDLQSEIEEHRKTVSEMQDIITDNRLLLEKQESRFKELLSANSDSETEVKSLKRQAEELVSGSVRSESIETLREHDKTYDESMSLREDSEVLCALDRIIGYLKNYSDKNTKFDGRSGTNDTKESTTSEMDKIVSAMEKVREVEDLVRKVCASLSSVIPTESKTKEVVEEALVSEEKVELLEEATFELATQMPTDKSPKAEQGLQDELLKLKQEILEMRKTKEQSEAKVREEFDDILKSLRVDLQNALIDSRKLQEEVFHLKSLDEKEAKEQDLVITLRKRLESEGNKIKTLEEELFHLKNAKMLASTQKDSDVSMEMIICNDIAIQTEVEVGHRPVEVSKLELDRELMMSTGRIKRHSSSERLPEVVAETLYSPLNIDSLQAYSDTSSLEGETFLGSGSDYPKLELRLSEEQEDGDKRVNDLLSENEDLKLKLEQSKKMIGKLKQIVKKCKNGLNATQSEKIEEIRGLEGVVATTRQELKLLKEERVGKDQELQSLREEVRSLVRDKENLLGSFRAKSDELNANFQSTVQELKAESRSTLIEKQEMINVLAQVQTELKDKVNISERNLELLDLERTELRKHIDELEITIKDQTGEILEKSQYIDIERERVSELTEKLEAVVDENTKLKERLSKPKEEKGTDNPGFDQEILDSYEEELERREDELEEAFDLIRRLEESSFQTGELYKDEKEEWNNSVFSLKEANETLATEKFGIEKSMQEMRQEMEGILREREEMVDHWKSKLDSVVMESSAKETALQTVLQQAITERDQQIALLNAKVEQLELQLSEVSDRHQSTLMKITELSNLNEEIEQFAATNKSELEKTLQERAAVEDKLTFYQSQVEEYVRQKEAEVNSIRAENESTKSAYENLLSDKSDILGNIQGLQNEITNLKHEIERRSKMIKKLNRENESVKKDKEELGSRIRKEMETVLTDIHDERTISYSNALEKESALQELRIHADLIMKEKDHWREKVRQSGKIESERLQGSSVDNLQTGSSNFTEQNALTPDDEGLHLQIQQLRREKDLTVNGLESIISNLKSELYEVKKAKSLQDLEIIELKSHLELLKKDVTSPKKSEIPSDKYEVITNVSSKVKGMRIEFEELKQETQQMTAGAVIALEEFKESLMTLVRQGEPTMQAEVRNQLI